MLSALTFLAVAAPICWAGVNGISPTDGTYKFVKSNGNTIDRGTFSTGSGGEKTLQTSANGDWKKDGGGNYQSTSLPRLSACFHATSSGTPPYSYEFKVDGDAWSTGTLEP